MVLSTPEATSIRTFHHFQKDVGETLKSLGENHDPEAVTNALMQLDMNYEQIGIDIGTGFLTGDYWTTVKTALDVHEGTISITAPGDDPCKFSREIILAKELEKADYSAEEAIAIIIQIRGKVILRKNIHRRSYAVQELVT